MPVYFHTTLFLKIISLLNVNIISLFSLIFPSLQFLLLFVCSNLFVICIKFYSCLIFKCSFHSISSKVHLFCCLQHNSCSTSQFVTSHSIQYLQCQSLLLVCVFPIQSLELMSTSLCVLLFTLDCNQIQFVYLTIQFLEFSQD